MLEANGRPLVSEGSDIVRRRAAKEQYISQGDEGREGSGASSGVLGRGRDQVVQEMGTAASGADPVLQ